MQLLSHSLTDLCGNYKVSVSGNEIMVGVRVWKATLTPAKAPRASWGSINVHSLKAGSQKHLIRGNLASKKMAKMIMRKYSAEFGHKEFVPS